MDTTDIYSADWTVARTYLRARFREGKITHATRKDLERALVVLAQEPDKEPFPKEAEVYRSTVSHLLQVRISEELHLRSRRLAIIALWLSGFSILLTVVFHFRR